MWSLAIELMIAQIVVFIFVILSWILQPHWIQKILVRYRVPAGVVLWITVFLLLLAAMDHGFICGLIVATTTVSLTSLALRAINYANKKSKDSVSQNQKEKIRKHRKIPAYKI